MMTLKKISLTSLFLCAAMVCAGPKEDFEKNLQSQKDNESKGLRKRNIVSSDKMLRAKVYGKKADLQKYADHKYKLVIDLGRKQNMTCSIMTESNKSAILFTNTYEGIERATDEVTLNKFEVESYKNNPFFFGEIQFLTKGSKPEYKVAKVAVSLTKSNSILCSHDGMGYEKTFLKNIRILTETLAVKDNIFNDSRYESLYFQYNDKKRVGFRVESSFEKDGKIIFTRFSSKLIPLAGGKFSSQDTGQVEESSKKGELINVYASFQEDGGQAFEGHLQQDATGYKMLGTVSGKEITYELESAKLLGNYQRIKQSRTLATSRKLKKTRIKSYMDDISSKNMHDVQCSKLKKRKIKCSFDATESEIEFNRKGHVFRRSIQDDQEKTVIKYVSSTGKLK